MDLEGKSRRERRQDRMRQQILQAAQDVLGQHGLEQLSLRLIADRLDVTAATLYRYFESKDAIVAALIAESKHQLQAFMEQVPTGLPPGDRLIALGLSYLDFAKAHPALFQLAFLDMPSDRTSPDTPVPPSSAYGLLVQSVEAAAGAGCLRPELKEAPETLAYAIWALAHGMAVLEATHLRRFETDFDAAHRLAFRLMVEGMTSR